MNVDDLLEMTLGVPPQNGDSKSLHMGTNVITSATGVDVETSRVGPLSDMSTLNGSSPETGDMGEDTLQALPFQLEAVERMLFEPHNWLLADEMGLGKTVQALLYINKWETLHRRLANVLVVCPNSLRLNWQNECRRWLNYSKRDIEQCTTQMYMPCDFTIASFEGVRRWPTVLSQTKWDILIVDEAHYCKTPSAARSKAVFNLNATTKIYMTGTPIVNYPYELFPLLHSLDPETWHEAIGFQSRYCHPTQHKYGRNLQELHARLTTGTYVGRYGRVEYDHQPIMIRRLKKDVLSQLPKKRRQIIEVPTDGNPALKKLVEYEKSLFEKMSGKVSDAVVDEIMAALNVTHEAGGSDEDLALVIDMLKGSRQFYFEEMSRIRHQLALAKVPLLIEHIDEVMESFNDDEKLVVFTHHNDVADKLHSYYRVKYGAVRVTGLSTPVHERQANVDRFQTDPKCRVFIGSMRAAGLGLTLTASHHVVFGELDWTPAVLSQCEDRCHRIGQEHPLLVQHVVVEGSMDSFMAKKIVAKQKSIKLALDGAKK